MPKKSFCKILRGRVLRRHHQDHTIDRKQQAQRPLQPSLECQTTIPEPDPTCNSSVAASGSLIRKLANRFSSTKRDIRIPAMSLKQRYRPHSPQEPLEESWMQPALLEFRQTDPASAERTPLLTPLKPLRRLTDANCQATALSEPYKADTSGTPVRPAELFLAKTSNWIGWPDTSVNNNIDSAGDYHPNEGIDASIDEGVEKSVEQSVCESLVSDCVMRLCMTTPESLKHNTNHSNYSGKYKRGALHSRSDHRRERLPQMLFLNSDQHRHHCNSNHSSRQLQSATLTPPRR